MLKVHAFQTFDLSSFSLPLTIVTLGKGVKVCKAHIYINHNDGFFSTLAGKRHNHIQ